MIHDISIEIETPRLLLRVPREEDFAGFCALMGDEEAARYVGGQQPPAVIWRGMASLAGSWALHGFGMFSMIEKSTGEWVGRTGPWRPAEWPGNEVGWGVVRSHWGKGYAMEAAIASMDFAVDKLGWTDIIHCIDPANANSQKLAQRLGSANRGQGRMPAPFNDKVIDIWGQTADEWRTNRTRLGAA